MICGELWLIFGFSGVRFGLLADSCGCECQKTPCFLLQKRGQVVVIRVAAVVLLLVVFSRVLG